MTLDFQDQEHVLFSMEGDVNDMLRAERSPVVLRLLLRRITLMSGIA